MIEILFSLLPLFVVILIGYWLRQGDIVPDGFWEPAEKLTLFVFFPSLLATELAEAEMALVDFYFAAIALSGALVVAMVLLWGMRPWLLRRWQVTDQDYLALFLGALRSNGVIAFAAAGLLFGQAGITLTAFSLAVLIPLTTLLSLAALWCYDAPPRDEDDKQTGAAGTPATASQTTASRATAPPPSSPPPPSPQRRCKGRVRPVLAGLGRDPLVLACLIGLIAHTTGAGLPVVGPVLALLAEATVPLGLLVIGATLSLADSRLIGPVLPGAVVTRLAVLPLLTAVGCWLLDVRGITAAVVVLVTALPAASCPRLEPEADSAKQLSAILSLQVLIALLSLPVILAGLKP